MKRTRNKSGFFVGVTCPGCGGELELESDFFVLECDFCGSVHRIVMPDVPTAYLVPARVSKREARFSIDRHLKKKLLPLTGSGLQLKRLYYPYWKADAVVLKVRNKVHRRVIVDGDRYSDEVVSESEKTEISLTPYTATVAAGYPMDGIPDSIGMRTEYIKLVPFSRDNLQDDFDSLPVLRPWQEAQATLASNVSTIREIDAADFGLNRTELFHPRFSLLYFPFLVVESYAGRDYNRFVVDGVSGRVLSHATQVSFDETSEHSDAPQLELGELKVVPHRCPTCGVDLPAVQSYVYVCRNCHELVAIDDQSGMIKEVRAAEVDQANDDGMFPFWSFGMSAADARSLRPMFGGLFSSDRLVIPAFRMQSFDAMCRLAKRISTAMPKIELTAVESLDERYRPVNIGLTEALVLADILIHREKYARGRDDSGDDGGFRPVDVSLFYAPFHPQSYFYVDSVLNAVTFEKNLVH